MSTDKTTITHMLTCRSVILLIIIAIVAAKGLDYVCT
jgi:hypothetical protein